MSDLTAALAPLDDDAPVVVVLHDGIRLWAGTAAELRPTVPLPHQVRCPSCSTIIHGIGVPITGQSDLPPCARCWQPIDPAHPHRVTVEQTERHDPPGQIHVTDAVVVVARHEGCT